VSVGKITLRIRKVGLVIKHHQPEAAVFASELVNFLHTEGMEVFFAKESEVLARELKRTLSKKARIQVVPKPKMPSLVDLILVLGGDGTYLSIARLMKNNSVPVLGINMGQLGFLTEVMPDQAIEFLQKLIHSRSVLIHERSLLEVTLSRKGKVVFQELVVNDAVISKGTIARIIGMQIWVDNIWVNHVRADGVIVSTTTGATAYALAAGGPLVDPAVPALVIAPICAHSLTLRPLVISDRSEVRIALTDRPDQVVLTLDGQDAVDMHEGDEVRITRFKKHSLKLIPSPDQNYYNLLREKLKFGIRD
jgi:NAD+ kinase